MKQKEKGLFALTWPVFIELLLNILVGNVDQFMLSSYSQDAVAAVGNANQILNILILLFTVINLSTTILSSQYLGSFQEKRAHVIYNLSLFMNLVFSLVVSTVVFLGCRRIYEFMKIPEELMDDAVWYISIVGGFIFLQGMNTAIGTMLKTQQLMKATMVIAMLMNVVNVLGNALLINGPGPFPALGTTGAAIATAASRLIGLVLSLVILFRKTDIRFHIRYLRPFPHQELRKMLSIGVPSAGENMSYSLSQTAILRIVNRFGVFVINTKVYVNCFQMFSVMYSASISQVAQILVSRTIGAGDLEEANRRIYKTLVYSVAIGVVISTLIFIFSEPLVSIFSKDPRILSLARKLLFIEIFLEIGKCGNVALVRTLQAAGDTKFPVLVGIVVMWIAAVGLSYVLGVICNLGLVGVWIAMAADELIRCGIFFVRWRRGKWRSFSLINNE